jgi:hypothetical protein
MTVYLLTTGFSGNTLERASLLEDACRQRNVDCIVIESTTSDRLTLPTLKCGDALYNATRHGLQLEDLLWRPGVATFYANGRAPRGIQDTTRWVADHNRAEISQPRTIVHATASRILLEKYVDFLGGFPIVLKVAGCTLGTGVMRADSWPSLLSLVDYLVATGTDFILRQSLPGSGSFRLMVIGEQVVGTLQYDNPVHDFRTNASSESHPRLVQTHAESAAVAVAAVQAIGMELGGVDIMVDQDGKPYLLESNIPCGFATFPKLGVDVPGLMIDHLINKSERLRNG